MVNEMYWAMTFLGWAIAFWALGVNTGQSRGRQSRTEMRQGPQPMATVQASAPEPPETTMPSDAEESHIDNGKRQAKMHVHVPFNTIYLSRTKSVFHTHLCSSGTSAGIRDVEQDMTQLNLCKMCRKRCTGEEVP